MTTPAENDPALARFRRGAAKTGEAVPVGPPPPVGSRPTPPSSASSSFAPPPMTMADFPAPSFPAPSSPPPSTAQSAVTAPPPVQPSTPASSPTRSPYAESLGIQPLFGDLGRSEGDPSAASGAGAAYAAYASDPADPDAAYSDWESDDVDPGRGLGIASVIVGVFVGIVGLVLGIVAVRRSRSVALIGAWGVVGIVVSTLSLIVACSIGLSWLRYETDLANQCAVSGPGNYLTQSGTTVTCH